MSKKIMLFAMMVTSAVALSVPAIASAAETDVPLHIVPKPAVDSTVEGPASALSATNGNTVTCEKVHGSAKWASSTAGTLNLVFSGNCTAHTAFGTIGCGSITTGTLPFELVTVPGAAGQSHKPGVLITKPANGPFATFVCGGFLHFQVEGTGSIGTIIAPACGAVANTATVKFEVSSHGISKHKHVVSTGTANTVTPTTYNLSQGGNEAGMSAHATIKFAQNHTLECT